MLILQEAVKVLSLSSNYIELVNESILALTTAYNCHKKMNPFKRILQRFYPDFESTNFSTIESFYLIICQTVIYRYGL